MARVSSGLVAACLASSATGWLLGRWTRRYPRAELRWLRQELTATSNALIEAEQERADLRRAQRELITAISHEMRTPLAGIRAAAEALQDGVAQEPQRYLDGLIGGAQRLNRVTGDLFELARLQVETVERTPTRLADLLDSALAAALPVALERGVRLHGVGLDSATDPVRVDIAVLTRALANLVMHAVRHTVPGEPVTVTAMVSGDEIEVIVVDGCGGAADFESALEPADSGLAITRGLIRAHGGDVRVDQVTDGCRFTTRLPAGLT
ncbi:HAMP domain-containing sensor histidine kinase [Saccharopolyspora sp. WRP15-2]|uniref:Sensor-like histidine kinase SenX3 n=1 Tax=Saccharopolyspora oryzae TaxID=2997343 RepID=A0ABT4V1Q1_9PSEU|nr:HAMP domain-containing sensor histidine kinase [Saccharopolyspora oryzae]MDA3627891.1 HAMP domain-containing sensor histidine kinase [Saccharopolyspora oryzae]